MQSGQRGNKGDSFGYWKKSNDNSPVTETGRRKTGERTERKKVFSEIAGSLFFRARTGEVLGVSGGRGVASSNRSGLLSGRTSFCSRVIIRLMPRNFTTGALRATLR
ncbi:hypothetical protein GWI33_001026 [Rhynchophorus ferrugineus]|uniref:Uncharacterized protein n=1 Tax=Rhynchophorus ferrugineus TaxID=354439 RepID=A0A834MGN1_RHYFE|nr:hypothetical protein GWI33_001026 [Rhynchophorus ferrugineus]